MFFLKPFSSVFLSSFPSKMNQNRTNWTTGDDEQKKRTHENSGCSNSMIVLAQGIHKCTNHECETPDQHITRLTWFGLFLFIPGFASIAGQMFLCVNRCYRTPIVSPNNHHSYQLPYQQMYLRLSHFIGCFGRRLVFICAFGVSVSWWSFTDLSWPFSISGAHMRPINQPSNRCTNDTHSAHCAHAVNYIDFSPRIAKNIMKIVLIIKSIYYFASLNAYNAYKTGVKGIFVHFCCCCYAA